MIDRDDILRHPPQTRTGGHDPAMKEGLLTVAAAVLTITNANGNIIKGDKGTIIVTDEQTGAWEQNADQLDRQLALGAAETRCDRGNEQRCGQDARQHQDGDDEREDGSDRAGHARRLLALATSEKRGVDGNERGRERALAEQILQRVRDAKRRHEGVRRIGFQAEVVGEDALADEAGDAAAEDADCHPCGRTPNARRARLRPGGARAIGRRRGHAYQLSGPGKNSSTSDS